MAKKQIINTKIQNILLTIEVFVKFENPCAVVAEQNFTSMDSAPDTFFKSFGFFLTAKLILIVHIFF